VRTDGPVRDEDLDDYEPSATSCFQTDLGGRGEHTALFQTDP